INEALAELELRARRLLPRRYRGLLSSAASRAEPDAAADEHQLFERAEKLRGQLDDEVRRFRQIPLLKLFRVLPLWLFGVLLLGFAAAVPVLPHFGVQQFSLRDSGIAAGVFVVVLAVYFFARHRASAPALALADKLAQARRLVDAAAENAAARWEGEQQRVKAEFEGANRELSQQWRQTIKGAIDLRGTRPAEVDEQAQRAVATNERLQ